ncbi:NosD domain-containing protein [Paenibacillus azoreducens]|uniref:NosD domain-containing protein n=1 Tax=Paenibacillus azoreducens TaxID=116718 RepID=UPI0039F608D5
MNPGTGFAGDAESAAIPLQPMIDQARAGDVIRLAPGTYLGPVTIGKSIAIEGGGGATIINDSDNSAITVHASGTRLQGLNIRHQGKGETAGIEVHAQSVQLEQLKIRTQRHGIMVRDASKSVIRNNDIAFFADQPVRIGKKGNGIDLYNSQDNQILNNKIAFMKDAIYMEKGRNETVNGNEVSYSRYGIHFMYIDDSRVTHNSGEFNITGAMVMEVSNLDIADNMFRKQSGNVNSQGLLLYDVRESRIDRNVIEGNRVGIYMERAEGNRLAENALLQNFVGIQMIQAKNNLMRRNTFVSNVIEATERESDANRLTENYWDSFQGLDVTNDGLSDIPYRIQPFFQRVIAGNSAYQLFFQSPSISFLSDIFAAGGKASAADDSPLMKPDLLPSTGRSSNDGGMGVLIIGLILLLTSVFTISLGGIRK